MARAWKKDPGSLANWEAGRGKPKARDIARMEAYVAKAKAKLEAELHGTRPAPVTRPRRRRG